MDNSNQVLVIIQDEDVKLVQGEATNTINVNGIREVTIEVLGETSCDLGVEGIVNSKYADDDNNWTTLNVTDITDIDNPTTSITKSGIFNIKLYGCTQIRIQPNTVSSAAIISLITLV